MKYGNIQYLWMLWIVPVLALFFIWSFKRKMYLISKFASPELRDRLLQGVSFTRQKIKMVALIVCTLFLIFSMIRPKWGFHWEEVKRKGVDIIVALDVSKSMLAKDVSPNRLERAKREIVDLLRILEGDRVALVAFAGVSFLQSPLTLDYGAVQIFLDDLDVDLIPVPGTAIGEAIKTATKSFDQKDKKSRVLILITDGEDHGGNPTHEAKLAAKQMIKIYTIGIGKEGGAPIPDLKNGGFKKNRKGEMILTKLDEDSLRQIALATGGSYVRSITGDLDLEKIYESIRKNVEDKELESGKRKRFEERFQWPLAVAIIFLLFELLYSERRRKKKILSILLFFFIFTGTNAQAQFLTGFSKKGEDLYNSKKYDDALKQFTDDQISSPQSSELKYNMADTYYKMKQYKEAEKLFSSTALYGDKKMSQKSYYNLGNTTYRMGKLKESVEHYKKALELDPNDKDAKFNLEFVREEIKRRIEENKKRKKQQKNNKQCDNKKKKQNKDKKKDNQDKKQQNKDKKKENQDNKKKNEEEKKQEEGEQKPSQANKMKEDKKKKMDKEEAARWLRSLDEDRKKHLKKKMKGRGQYQVEKDW